MITSSGGDLGPSDPPSDPAGAPEPYPAADPAAVRRATLASDGDRDLVCGLLSQAFSQGRLTAADLDERTTRALAARTYGDLDTVLAGLVTPTGTTEPTAWAASTSFAPTAAQSSIVPKALFWIVAFFSAPFVFFSAIFLLAVEGWTSKVMGLVILVAVMPGLIALHRRAYPRR